MQLSKRDNSFFLAVVLKVTVAILNLSSGFRIPEDFVRDRLVLNQI